MHLDASISANERVPSRRLCEHPAVEAVPGDWPGRSMSRMLEVDGGCWHVQRAGAGPPLLLLHGTAASTHTWRMLTPLLAEDYDVLALDLPGHGFSERLPGKAMSLPEISRGIARLLDSIGFEPQCAVGHSAGAAIALRMTIDAMICPTCVIGLNAALLPFGGGLQRLFAPMAQLFANTRLMPRMVSKRANDIKAVRRVLRGTGSILDADGVELYQRLLQRESHVAAVLSMMASWDLQPLLNDLPKLESRLHLVAGTRDKAVSPREAEKIAAALPGTTVTRLENCGHLAHEERAGRIAELIRTFCPPVKRDQPC